MDRISPITTDRECGRAYIRESVALPPTKIPRTTAEYLAESMSDDMPDMIFPMFHALRAEKITRNRTFYTLDALAGDKRKKTGIYSMLYPYRIPYIKDHATGGWSGSSELYGRVVNAFMVENALEGAKAAAAIVAVPHPEAIKQILNGNWLTVSMGSRTEEVNCGICGADLIESPCQHNPWDDKEFYTIIGAKGFQFREISQVTLPSDYGAILQATNVDPSEFKLYAGNAKKECVYNVMDPTHANLLESSIVDENAITIAKQFDWLLEEFRPIRKRVFALQESAKELSMKIAKSRECLTGLADLSDAEFGVLYIDQSSQKTIRRFPMPEEMTEEQCACVRAQIEHAKDLDTEQVSALIARLEVEKRAGEPITITINEENYTHLLDVIDELREMVETETVETVVEDTAGSEETETAQNTAEQTETADAAGTQTEEARTEEATSEPTELEVLHAQLEAERMRRMRLQAEKIARQQISLGEKATAGKTVEELVEKYVAAGDGALNLLEELLAPTFDAVHVDVTNIEQVDNPVDLAQTEDAAPSQTDSEREKDAEEANAKDEQSDELARFAALFNLIQHENEQDDTADAGSLLL